MKIMTYKNKATERAILWAKNNPERFKASQKRYRDNRKISITDEDRNKARERNRQWRRENPDKVRIKKREYMRRRRARDPKFREDLLEKKREWASKHIEHINEYARKRYRNNPIVREKHSKYSMEKSYNMRLEVLYWYSAGCMRCEHCGDDHFEFLSIDHTNGGGSKHRRSGSLKKYSNNIYLFLVKTGFPDGYRVLCHNCNYIAYLESLPSTKDTAYNRHRKRRRNEMLEKYSRGSMKCKCCGMSDIRCLTFHHVNGGGTRDRRDKKYYDLVQYLYRESVPLSEIDVLCQNCNKSLGHYGYIPTI